MTKETGQIHKYETDDFKGFIFMCLLNYQI